MILNHKLLKTILSKKELDGLFPRFATLDGSEINYFAIYGGENIFAGTKKQFSEFADGLGDAVKKGGKSGGGKYLDDVGDIAKFTKIKNKFPNEKMPDDGYILDFIIDSKGILKSPNGSLLTTEMNFIITKTGKLKLGLRHHLLSNAEDVLAAGSIKIKRGKITEINNLSGHYKPTVEETFGFIDVIKEMNIPIKRANLKVYDFITNSKGYDIEENLFKTIIIENNERIN